eukprot:3827282-Rhodomonas_salina.1
MYPSRVPRGPCAMLWQYSTAHSSIRYGSTGDSSVVYGPPSVNRNLLHMPAQYRTSHRGCVGRYTSSYCTSHRGCVGRYTSSYCKSHRGCVGRYTSLYRTSHHTRAQYRTAHSTTRCSTVSTHVHIRS